MKAGKNYKVKYNSENETFCTLNNIPTHYTVFWRLNFSRRREWLCCCEGLHSITLIVYKIVHTYVCLYTEYCILNPNNIICKTFILICLTDAYRTNNRGSRSLYIFIFYFFVNEVMERGEQNRSLKTKYSCVLLSKDGLTPLTTVYSGTRVFYIFVLPF